MASRFRHEDVASVPSGWKVRTVTAGTHRVRVAFPPGRRHKGSGRLVSVLHPLSGSNPCTNPCTLRGTNPAELMVMSANNPPRRRNAEAKQQREFVRHQVRIAKETLRMPDQIAQAMGGMTKEQARAILHQHGISFKENPKNSGKIFYVRHTDTDANVIRHYGPFTKEVAEAKAQHFRDIGHKGEVIETPARFLRGGGRKLAVQRGFNPSELLVMAANPRVEVVHGENPPVEDITEEFSGTEVKWLDVYNEPHIPRGRYAYLAKLFRLLIKPAKGGQVQKITFAQDGENAPLIVSDSSARQIYFVGGNQDISGCLELFLEAPHLPIGPSTEVARIGQAREIHYIGKKHHIGDEDTDEWRHTHGEENGVLPTVLFDTRNKRLLYEGGDYRIEGPWIHN